MYNVKLGNIEPIAGYASRSAQKGEMVDIVVKDFLTSGHPGFYTCINHLTSIYLGFEKTKIFPDAIISFLIILHSDATADVYINDFTIRGLIRSKKDLKSGSLILQSEILDIVSIKFDDINIQDSDCIIYCFKINWKFGLYFDLLHNSDNNYKLDLGNLQKELARHYRYMMFENVYQSIEDHEFFEKLLVEGWFPFIQLIGAEYETILSSFENSNIKQEQINKILNDFDKERINTFTQYWWKNKIFNDKRKLLEAGIDAYLENNDNGFINCIKNLYSEIDGILRLVHPPCIISRIKTSDMRSNLLKIAGTKCEQDSLFFINEFDRYLKDILYKGFDLSTGKIEISRPSTCHGVAEVESYDKTHALQSILILDQLFFYIN